MMLKQVLKAFRWKWSVHGVGLAMAIGFLIGSSALVPGGLLNNPNSPPKFKYGPPTEHLPPPPDELGGRRGQRCNIPGTVQNDSSHVIYLKGDVEKENGDLVEEFYNLQPGQFSTVHNCDIDYIASTARYLAMGRHHYSSAQLVVVLYLQHEDSMCEPYASRKFHFQMLWHRIELGRAVEHPS